MDKEILEKKMQVSRILFKYNVPIILASFIGTFIEDLEQQCKKQKEVIDKVRNNLEKDISVIKNVKMSNKEIICRLEETNKMLKKVSE
jgi:flagellar biosynthesis component FlhA